MSYRLEPFVNNSIYHIFTRSIDSRIIFERKGDFYPSLFLKIIRYYRSSKATISFSYLSRLRKEEFARVLKAVSYHKYFRVEVLAYCLMPTHFHLLLKQKKEKGIPRFISDVLNSFTRYFNLKNKRKGPLFLPKFKSSSINSDELLGHVSRYIHLNPYSSGIITDLGTLEEYPWSSFSAYARKEEKDDFLNNKEVLGLFGFDKGKYRDFVLDNADYQKTLESLKYAEKW